MKKKQQKPVDWKQILTPILVLFGIALVMVLVMILQNRETPAPVDPFAEVREEAEAAMEEAEAELLAQVEAEMEDRIQHGQFNYEIELEGVVFSPAEYNFHFIELMYFIHEYYTNRDNIPPFEIDIPLYEQPHWYGGNWEEYVHRAVEEMLMQYVAARQQGIGLTPNRQMGMDGLENWLMEIAAAENRSVDEMIDEAFPGVTAEMYLQFILRENIVESWREHQVAQMSFTMAEMSQFYDDNWDEIDPWNDGQRSYNPSLVDIRHIFFSIGEGSQLNHETAGEAATAIYEAWQAGPATEANFEAITEAEIATNPDAIGGLQQNVWERQMTPEMDEWIFAEGRAPGDASVVATHFGYHVVYFVNVAAIDWEERTERAMTDRTLRAQVAQLADQYTVTRR